MISASYLMPDNRKLNIMMAISHLTGVFSSPTQKRVFIMVATLIVYMLILIMLIN
jgi:hypothetical protein